MTMKSGFRRFIYALTLPIIFGCSSPIQTYYAKTEAALDTRFGILGDNGLYHDVLYNPEVIALNFEGFVVGIDKSPRNLIGASPTEGRVNDLYNSSTQKGMDRVISRLQNDPKAHYVSHIVWNRGKPFGDGNCYLYSVYSYQPVANDSPRALTPLATPCDGVTTQDPAIAFFGSFEAVDVLTSLIQDQLRTGSSYTHVLFVVMGWNTPQIEAIRNFNSLVANLRRASGKGGEFNPLFIGVTWSSYWDQSWFQTLVQAASYKNKADDADELGAGWLGYLFARISAATPQLRKVVIGHSFGARAASMAICMGAQFNNSHASLTQFPLSHPTQHQIDLFIALQPAVSINRFLENGGWDEIEYPESCAGAKQIVVTASSGDEALPSAFWADMAGKVETRDAACAEKKVRFKRPVACVRAREDGSTDPPSGSITEDFVYVDASKLVYFNHPNTGGGAHSDIYRPETGRFMWQWFPRR